MRVRGRARDVGNADGVAASGAVPGRGGGGSGEEEGESPAGRVARVGVARVAPIRPSAAGP